MIYKLNPQVKTHESNKTIVKAELRDVKYDKQPKEEVFHVLKK